MFNRATALKWVRHFAKTEPAADAIVALLRPTGTVVGMYVVGTARTVPAGAARHARQQMNDLLPDIQVRKRPRPRTSRKATRNERGPKSSRRKTTKRPTRTKSARRTSRAARPAARRRSSRRRR